MADNITVTFQNLPPAQTVLRHEWVAMSAPKSAIKTAHAGFDIGIGTAVLVGGVVLLLQGALSGVGQAFGQRVLFPPLHAAFVNLRARFGFSAAVTMPYGKTGTSEPPKSASKAAPDFKPAAEQVAAKPAAKGIPYKVERNLAIGSVVAGALLLGYSVFVLGQPTAPAPAATGTSDASLPTCTKDQIDQRIDLLLRTPVNERPNLPKMGCNP